MKERPIIMTADSVCATLEDRKTQTRRVTHFKPLHDGLNFGWSALEAGHYCTGAPMHGWVLRARRGDGCWEDKTHRLHCPYGNVGDRIWVRETWRTEELDDGLDGIRYKADNGFQSIEDTAAAADAWIETHFQGLGEGRLWRSPIFMPRWASRLTLEIVNIRVERLQKIHPQECVAEGASPNDTMIAHDRHLENFARIWNLINARRGYPWDSNPWVWVIQFKRVTDV